MDRTKTAVGFGAGAAFMYFFDPNLGRRRRAVLFDKIQSVSHDFLDELDKARRDLVNRAHGMLAAAKSSFTGCPADEHILIERVRSRIGRVVSHPHAITVSLDHGRVVLQGPILEREVEELLNEVKAVCGVREVVNRLEVHREADDVPGLQGGVPRIRRSEFMQQSWTPALRVAAGTAGAALLCYGLRKDHPVGRAAVLPGAALLMRAIVNKEFRRIFGAGGPRLIEFDKTIHIHAPVEEVFRFWTNYQNFPRFMTHLKEVRDLGNGRSHWVAEGPGGVSVSWDAEITAYVPNKLLAWRSVPGSRVETEGVVRLDENPDGSTRVTIRLFYNPPAGVLGHLVASLFSADPKHEMDEDMIRLKSLLETGKTRAHGMRVTREEVTGACAPALDRRVQAS
jgi:uncharacterized membrane protein